MRKAFLARFVVGMLGCVLFYSVRVDPVQKLWAHLGAMTGQNLIYTHFPGMKAYPHGINAVYPRTLKNRHHKEWSGIGMQCTYLHVIALVFPFLVTRIKISAVVSAGMAALVLVWSINFLRFVVLYWLLRLDFTWFVAHDVPNAIATCLAVGIAVAFFVRHQRRLRGVSDVPAENPVSISG